jgi:hypothetical protein
VVLVLDDEDLSFVVSVEVEPLAEPEAEPEPCAEDVSLDAGADELDEDEDGAEDGVLVEPEPAEPLIELDEEPLGAVDELLSLLMSTDVEDELEPEGAVLGVEAVPPADDEDDEPAGARVAPDGALVELELEAPSLARSQAAINEAPSARETATAIVESLMRPPWLGYKYWAARIGPGLLNLNPISSSSSAGCRCHGDPRRRPCSGNRDAGRHASDRPGPVWGWPHRAFPRHWARRRPRTWCRLSLSSRSRRRV